jgi:hypothetical protein
VEAELRDKLVTISDDEDTGEDSQKMFSAKTHILIILVSYLAPSNPLNKKSSE